MARVRSVNTSNKRIRKQMAEGLGPSPLCLPCGWDGKPVPSAWLRQMPGTEYPCDDPRIGEQVTLKGDTAPSTIVGCATPMGPGLLQMGRVSDRYACQGSLVVETPLGLRVPVRRSTVTELKRAAKPGRRTCRCAGLPYPHREGSLPQCELAPGGGVAGLEELARDAYEGDERDEARFITAARKNTRGRVETIEDAQRLIDALRQRQAAMYDAADARRMAPRSEYKKRVARAKRDARSEGWDV